MGLSSLTCGGWRSGITVPLPEAGGHDVDDKQERFAPFCLPDLDGDHL
jgi:hypothetical protein